MVNPHFEEGQPTMFICGNNDEAKKKVKTVENKYIKNMLIFFILITCERSICHQFYFLISYTFECWRELGCRCDESWQHSLC